jgi:hypothetical protein
MSELQAFRATQSPSTFADNEQEYMGERLHDDQRWRKGFAIATARDLCFRRTRGCRVGSDKQIGICRLFGTLPNLDQLQLGFDTSGTQRCKFEKSCT